MKIKHIITAMCIYCNKPYLKRTKQNVKKKDYKIRNLYSVTCSNECSKGYNKSRTNVYYRDKLKRWMKKPFYYHMPNKKYAVENTKV